VSAALLKKEGYEVTGVFIKAWTPSGYPCAWKEDRRSAMRVAAVLDIPFITLDLEKEYKKEVVDYMISEYKAGRTPNPDVMCNKEIKFGHFLKFALKNGADFVATGHYAKLSKNKKGSFVLSEAKDKNKDQSYFLWTLTQEQLKHILFPIGHLQKAEVRKLAKKLGLPQAEKKDSQGLCFLGKVDMKEFLSRYISQKKGSVLDTEGEIIGHHNGALFFTIGERHGFTITKKSDKEVPLYVAAKDIKKNTVTVVPAARKKIANGKVWPSDSEEIRGLFQEQFFSGGASAILSNINIINPTSLKLCRTKENLSCRIRYRQEKVRCKMEREKVIFDNPQMGVSPGQSLVLYDGEICLGGGIID